jgi:hypothetical protein
MHDEPSFAADIAPLFRPRDVRAMRFMFDLTDYDSVRENAGKIFERIEDGSMPCDAMWPEDKVELFERWIDTGRRP